jgi:hypothetical protein
MRKKVSRILLLATCAAMASMFASCAPTYDNIADQMLADTQKQADDGLLRLETLATRINSLAGCGKTGIRGDFPRAN